MVESEAKLVFEETGLYPNVGFSCGFPGYVRVANNAFGSALHPVAVVEGTKIVAAGVLPGVGQVQIAGIGAGTWNRNFIITYFTIRAPHFQVSEIRRLREKGLLTSYPAQRISR